LHDSLNAITHTWLGMKKAIVCNEAMQTHTLGYVMKLLGKIANLCA